MTLRVLIIDHYDSYTNNILQLLQQEIVELDGTTYPAWDSAIVRFDQFTWEDFRDTLLPLVDAIILSPGPGRPDKLEDFGFNTKLIQEANIPILGICLGHQGLGTSFGAKIIYAPNIKHGQVSQIKHTNQGILKGLPQGFDAVRYNSLVLDPDDIPSELEVTAWTYDAEDTSRKVLMGLQHRTRPLFGAQWHPESVCSSYGAQILSNFKDIVSDFWRTSTPHNHWTSRSIFANDKLAPKISSENVIPQEVYRNSSPVEKSLNTPATSDGEAPYFVKSFSLGIGPPAQYVFEKFIRGTTFDGESWLDSAKVRDVHSRNSYLSAGAFSLSYSTESSVLTFNQQGKKIKSLRIEESYWSWLDDFHSKVIQANTDALPAAALEQDAEVGQPILQVGLVGYLGYELKRESLPGYSYTAPIRDASSSSQADSQMIFTNRVLWLDNYTGQWKIFSLIRRGKYDPIADFIGSSVGVGLTESEFDQDVSKIAEAFSRPPSPVQDHLVPLPSFISDDNEASYSSSVEKAREAIREGETYELTLTTRFRARAEGTDPYHLYLSLRARNPAPYSAFLNFPTENVAILSSSPERFISIDRNGVAEMKPIKGTLAVSHDKLEDERRKHTLATDIKELAENLMIVDLIRADLHNISPSKSITVPKLLHVESYETVHQLVTTIQSQTAPEISSVRTLKAIFPPGSMTGAPKLRSVQILDSLERERPRGIYSGSLGYLCVSGTADQSVVIRTIVKDADSNLTLGAGGAITWLSQAGKEWEEVLVKANAVAKADAKPDVVQI